MWLFTDDKPLTNDYTEADIRTRANGSYQYLDVFNQGDPKELERILATVEDRDQTEAAWNQITKHRQAVDDVSHFYGFTRKSLSHATAGEAGYVPGYRGDITNPKRT